MHEIPQSIKWFASGGFSLLGILVNDLLVNHDDEKDDKDDGE